MQQEFGRDFGLDFGSPLWGDPTLQVLSEYRTLLAWIGNTQVALAKYVLGTTENKEFSIDYSAWLASGETISSVTSGVTQATVPPLVPTTPSIGAGSTGVTFFVSGGDGTTVYSVVITIHTSIGQIKADTINFVSKVIS